MRRNGKPKKPMGHLRFCRFTKCLDEKAGTLYSARHGRNICNFLLMPKSTWVICTFASKKVKTDMGHLKAKSQKATWVICDQNALAGSQMPN